MLGGRLRSELFVKAFTEDLVVNRCFTELLNACFDLLALEFTFCSLRRRASEVNDSYVTKERISQYYYCLTLNLEVIQFSLSWHSAIKRQQVLAWFRRWLTCIALEDPHPRFNIAPAAICLLVEPIS